MPDIGAAPPAAYLSDGEIIAWLQEKSDERYGELRGMMNVSTQRSEAMQELSDLKASVDSGTLSPSDALARMEQIRAEYAGTELGPELDALLLPMEAQTLRCLPQGDVAGTGQALLDGIDATGLPAQLKQDLKTAIQGTLDLAAAADGTPPASTPATTRGGGTQTQLDPTPAYAAQSFGSFKDDFSSKIQAEVDKLGRIDQLDLIKIQELMADGRQTEQMASNIISSRDQASNAITSNLRA